MGLLTTTLGWFPKPVELRRARWQHAEGEIELAALRVVEERAIAETLRLQESRGLDGQLLDAREEDQIRATLPLEVVSAVLEEPPKRRHQDGPLDERK